MRYHHQITPTIVIILMIIIILIRFEHFWYLELMQQGRTCHEQLPKRNSSR